MGPSGVPEVGNDNGLPESPPLAAYSVANSRRGAAAHHIKSECERFCCETLMAVFLGEERSANQDLLLMDVQTSYKTLNHIDIVSGGYLSGSYSSTSSNSTIQLTSRVGLVDNYFELWDYIGGTRFRGFIAERKGHRGLFAFFDQEVLGHNLKPSLLALIELCSEPEIDCSAINLCIDRELLDSGSLMKSFAWVGFEASTLAEWTDGTDIISERWLFLTLDT